MDRCKKCGGKKTLLLFTSVCDNCDPPKKTVSLKVPPPAAPFAMSSFETGRWKAIIQEPLYANQPIVRFSADPVNRTVILVLDVITLLIDISEMDDATGRCMETDRMTVQDWHLGYLLSVSTCLLTKFGWQLPAVDHEHLKQMLVFLCRAKAWSLL
jgi:hypothetical protein